MSSTVINGRLAARKQYRRDRSREAIPKRKKKANERVKSQAQFTSTLPAYGKKIE